MEVIQMRKQLFASEWPTKLEVLTELAKRNGLAQDDALASEYQRLQTGIAGEQAVFETFKAFGEPD